MLGMQILTQGILEAKGFFFSAFCIHPLCAAHPANLHKHCCSTEKREKQMGSGLGGQDIIKQGAQYPK